MVDSDDPDHDAVAVRVDPDGSSYDAADPRNTLPGVTSYLSVAFVHVMSLTLAMDTHQSPTPPADMSSGLAIDVDVTEVKSVSVGVVDR